MRIVLDGRALTGRYTGDRTYWRNLIRALPGVDSQNEYLIYSRTPMPEGDLPDAPNLTSRVVEAPNDRLWTLYALPQALRQDRADLVHVQYTAPPRSLCPCPIVTTVHDISFRLYPQWFPARHRLLLNLTVPAAMRSAARVITDSESSRQDILRVYHLPPEKLVTTLLGVPEEFRPAEWQESARQIAKERFGLERPFVLAVGVLQPRKNLRLLAEAFGKAKTAHKLPHQLALVGKAGWGAEHEALREVAARGGGPEAAEAVVFPGYVEDAALPILYQACEVFAHPALYEGFGIPPVEAMACGAPVLVSDAPAMPEVCGEAALVLPATNVDAWAEGLARVLCDADLRRDLAARGPRHAARYTWAKTAAHTCEVYQEARRA
jgi:glycosyltransferase involved in cell wall biosynthesis